MKTRTYIIGLNQPWNKRSKYKITDLCPNCGVSNNPTTKLEGYFYRGERALALFSHFCTSCQRYHWSLQIIYPDIEHEPDLLFVHPSAQLTPIDSKLIKLSPRFERMYHSAERAENVGDYDLAGMGYRAALEILIKDYAVEFTDEDKARIAKYKLNDAISHFYKNDQTAQISADVVRIYGNDYAHWDQPEQFNSEATLGQLKAYLQIFISWVNYRLMIANPPVSRQDNHSKK